MREDHQLVADILQRLRTLLADLDSGNLDRIKGEIAGLTAILESHFQWEERRIAEALDELSPTERTSAELFGTTTLR
ncbi:hemerythrin domain-containing protein [Nocardia sp. CA-128927]|uniref:hemerythrin domain-containing protein n=1 Tax=Nocardia sp. CA-128927 TaxID=3239975 RepID=UPI003D99CC4B